jgi:nicotinate-nucleotide adenylyltransferase
MAWVRPPGPVADGLRIGLLGGSFDPAHEGHRHVSDVALKALKLDYVWWLVSPGNPLKPAPAELATRLAAARQLAHAPRIRVTDIERALHTRYTADTVAALRRRFPRVQFIWLMGSDNLEQFSRWWRWRRIAALVPIAVVRRPGSVLAAIRAPLARVLGVSRRLSAPPSLVVLDGHRSFASSTALRDRAVGGARAAMLNPLP